MKPRQSWALAAIIVLVLGLGAWLLFGREREHGSEDGADRSSPTAADLGARKKLGSRSDSTTKLLGSDKATITGTVRDSQGQAIAGASVCAWSNQGALRGAGDGRPRCATSERDGHYRIAGLWPVSTSISASAAEFMPARWSERVDGRVRYELRLQPGQERRDVDLILAAGGVAVRGVVKDISGGVIEGALVSGGSGWWFAGNARASAWTNEDGRFELWAEPGDINLQAQASGYADASTSALAPTQRAEIFLTPESTISGVVTHAQTGAPIASATVWASSSGFFSRGRGEALTDEEGRFRITGLAPGIYDVGAMTDELYGEAIEQVHLGLAEQGQASVRMHPSFAIRGRIVIAETGEPCPSGSVSLDGDDFDKHASTEDEGAILIRAVLPGEYQVSVSCEGHVAEDRYESITIGDQPPAELEWKVHTGLSIRGVVVDHGGRELAQINVSARPKLKPGDDPRGQRTSSWGAETEADGSFEVAGLIAGTYELQTFGEHYPRRPEPVVVELGESDVEGVRIVLPATGRLEGIVRDETGQAVANVAVSARMLDAQWSERARTDDEGRFRFEHLQAGRHRVTAQIDWFNTMRAPGTGDDDIQGEVVTVTEGGTAEADLVVERRAGIIRGRVLDSHGAPVADAFVDVTRMSDSAASSPMWSRSSMRWGWDRKPVLSEHDGSFEFRELADGRYLIRAHREGGGEALLEDVAVGSTNAVLTIVETGRIAGKVVLAGGGAPERFTVQVRDRSSGLNREDQFFRSEGVFALRELPPGNYELIVSASQGSAQLDIELGPGENLDDLRIELVGKITVKGRLIDALTREPVPGFRVVVQARTGVFRFGEDAEGERRDISDADGRFEVDDAAVGKVALMITPRDMVDQRYGWAQRPLVLPAEPAEQDIGEIDLWPSRLAEREKPGDPGFKTKPGSPESEPEDTVFEVALIRPGGPAEGSGLEVGDRIVEVDGHTVSGLDSHRYGKLMRAPPGTMIELTIEGGKSVKIELGPPLE